MYVSLFPGFSQTHSAPGLCQTSAPARASRILLANSRTRPSAPATPHRPLHAAPASSPITPATLQRKSSERNENGLENRPQLSRSPWSRNRFCPMHLPFTLLLQKFSPRTIPNARQILQSHLPPSCLQNQSLSLRLPLPLPPNLPNPSTPISPPPIRDLYPKPLHRPHQGLKPQHGQRLQHEHPSCPPLDHQVYMPQQLHLWRAHDMHRHLTHLQRNLCLPLYRIG